MTVDDGLARVAKALDEVLAQRWDALALKMIGAGINPADRGTLGVSPPRSEGPPPGLSWQRLTFDEALQRQKDVDLEWRAELIAWLTTEGGPS